MPESFADIVVRFTAEGWHRWPDAPAHRSYLADRHRHLFHVEVRLRVAHHDREVEFHDLLTFVRDRWPGPELDAASCEVIAAGYLAQLRDTYPGRPATVSVFEDGEVGATVTHKES